MYRRPVYDENIKALIPIYRQKQEELRKNIKLTGVKHEIKLIAGCDSAFIEDKILSIFVIFEYPSLK